jgi:hypothetical protein
MIKETRTAAANSHLFINPQHARWLIGVLGMLIGVVGKKSLLGLILGQTRSEIGTLLKAEESGDGLFPEKRCLYN